jgi:hypothetical protein
MGDGLVPVDEDSDDSELLLSSSHVSEFDHDDFRPFNFVRQIQQQQHSKIMPTMSNAAVMNIDSSFANIEFNRDTSSGFNVGVVDGAPVGTPVRTRIAFTGVYETGPIFIVVAVVNLLVPFDTAS